MNIVHLVGVPKIYSGKVEDIASAAIASTRQELNFQEPLTVVIFQAQSFYVIPKLGISGSAVGKEGVIVKIDFSRDDIKEVVKVNLPATIYHEATHIAWENTNGDPRTLFDLVVSEGVACFVQQKLSPESDIPYIDPIDGENEYCFQLKKQKDGVEYDKGRWFFGTGNLPKWLGYRLGYLVVQKYVTKGNVSLRQLILTPQEKIEKILEEIGKV